jgi:hypothetical protein
VNLYLKPIFFNFSAPAGLALKEIFAGFIIMFNASKRGKKYESSYVGCAA